MSHDFYKTMFSLVHHLLICVYSRPLFMSVVTTHHTATWLHYSYGTMVHGLSSLFCLRLSCLRQLMRARKRGKIKKQMKRSCLRGLWRGEHTFFLSRVYRPLHLNVLASSLILLLPSYTLNLVWGIYKTITWLLMKYSTASCCLFMVLGFDVAVFE